MWNFGTFMKMVANWKYKTNSDLFILIGGDVGSGKSALAVMLANQLDSTFSKEMKERIAFSATDIEKFQAFIHSVADDMKEFINGNLKEKPKMKAFIIDEGQNILYRRNATTKTNKKIVQDIKTMRFLNSIVIVCIPDPYLIDSDIINRFDMVIVPDRQNNELHCWINKLLTYRGRYSFFFHQIEEMKKRKENINFDIDALYRKNIIVADVVGKTKYSKPLYEKYERLKIENSFKYDEISENEEKKEKTQKISVEVVDGGDGSMMDIVGEKAYLQNFYSYKALSLILNVKIQSLRNKISDNSERVRENQKGRRKYFLLKDVINLYK